MPTFESHKAHDLKFVAKVIRDNGLSPWPLKGYYQVFPLQWYDRKRGRNLQLEHYEWGTVLFASNDREPKWSSTLVCVGEIDWEKGTVSTPTETSPIPLPWIFAVRFEETGGATMPATDAKLPECVGWHDHCPTCDGGQNTVTGTVEVACPWRSRCYALKLYLMEVNQEPGQFLDSMKDTVELHERMATIERERLDRIPPPAATVELGRGVARGTLSPGKPARKRVRKRRKHNPLNFAPLEPLVKAFVKRLRTKMSEIGYGWAKSRASALHGQCYVHKATEKSNFLVVYVANMHGRYAKLAIVRYKISYACIDIAFVCDWEKALGVPGTKLRPVSQGRLGSAEWHGIKRKKTARIAARRIAKMVASKIIKLPALRSKS